MLHLQDQVEDLFAWKEPAHTASFLFVFSFVCLNPYLVIALPMVLFLLFVMVPGFLVRHPPPPPSTATSSTTPYYSYHGPALAPAQEIKPVPMTSHEFYENMRKTQERMAAFVDGYDAAVALTPIVNFADEKFSSTIFLALTITSIFVLLTAHLLPWGPLVMLGGNSVVVAKHPTVHHHLVHLVRSLKAGHHPTAPAEPPRMTIKDENGAPLLPPWVESMAQITIDSYPEEREVEIFELQHKSVSPYHAASEWDTYVFTPTPYDPLSPSRIAGDRPEGCRFFEDVRPPPGWAWKGPKWQLDLECREWVLERLITGVEFEIPTSMVEGGWEEIGGWVWDLPVQPANEVLPEELEDRGIATSYADEDWVDDKFQRDKKRRFSLTHARRNSVSREKAPTDIEEVNNGLIETGEWRRRRWIRVVRRVSVQDGVA